MSDSTTSSTSSTSSKPPSTSSSSSSSSSWTPSVVRDVVYLALLVVASVAFALTDHGQLAATALGGALGIAVPSPRVPVPPGAVPIVLALAAATLVTGCTGAQAAAGAELSCEIVHKLCNVAGAACGLVSSSTSGGSAP